MPWTEYSDLLKRAEQSDVVDVCRRLVQFVTVNPPGNELPCAEYIAGLLREAGCAVELIAHSASRASVIARLRGSGDLLPLVLCGHLDVVPVGEEEWTHDPFAGELADSRVWGRGSADMKGAVAAMMCAGKAIAEGGYQLRGDLITVLTAGEEDEQLGASVIASRTDIAPVQAIVIGEPTSNDVAITEKGALWLEVTMHGKTAHGAMPGAGENAIMMALAFLGRFREMELAPPLVDRHLGTLTRSIAMIRGGVKPNVVPDQCTVTIDLRTLPGQSHTAILGGVQELLDALSESEGVFKASVRVINDRRPVATRDDNSAVQRFCRVVGEVCGLTPEPRGVAYCTDGASLVPAFGAPMVICGPGSEALAHQPNEHVEVAKLIEAVKVYALAALEFLG
jgi:succinyl-diaminopimelate desuccinylase